MSTFYNVVEGGRLVSSKTGLITYMQSTFCRECILCLCLLFILHLFEYYYTGNRHSSTHHRSFSFPFVTVQLLRISPAVSPTREYKGITVITDIITRGPIG